MGSGTAQRIIAVVLLGAACACSSSRSEARPAGSSCGSYDLAQGEQDPTSYERQQECMLDAFASGRRATLSYSFPTEEGDPIEVDLTVVGNRLVEVRTDDTGDRFGSGEVRTERCSELRASEGHFDARTCSAP